MATLSYVRSGGGWDGYVNISYSVSYDPATNRTTITFGESNHRYFGRSGYGSWAKTVIKVTASDNPDSEVTVNFNTEGNTTGGVKTFTGTPSPASVTIQHSWTPGEKSVVISGSTTFFVAMSSSATSQSYGYANGSKTEAVGSLDHLVYIDNGSGFDAYGVYIDNGTSWDFYVPYVDNGSGWEPVG